MDPRDALKIALEREMDLVEVSPQTKPPVCRMMDYGRWKYEAAKKTRETTKLSKVKKRAQEIREVKLRPKIDEHDFQVKSKMVRRLLQEGDKVKVTMMFRGREVVHAEIGLKLLQRVFTDTGELAIIENKPRLEGKNMIMVLAPKLAGGGLGVGFGDGKADAVAPPAAVAAAPAPPAAAPVTPAVPSTPVPAK
jgi:translation initiation factor IF-3